MFVWLFCCCCAQPISHIAAAAQRIMYKGVDVDDGATPASLGLVDNTLLHVTRNQVRQ